MVGKTKNQKTRVPEFISGFHRDWVNFLFSFCLMEHNCLERFNKPCSKCVSSNFYKLKMHLIISNLTPLVWFSDDIWQNRCNQKESPTSTCIVRLSNPPQVQIWASHHIYTSCHYCIKVLIYATFLPVGIRHFRQKWQVHSSLYPAFHPQTLSTLTLLMFAQNPEQR